MSRPLVLGFVGGVVGALATALILLVAVALVDPKVALGQPSQGTPNHEQMHQMMDAVHGPGTSQRMHEAMGPEAEKLMDQCVAMMGMMGNMANVQGMIQSPQAMQGMMGGMMGR